jgi:hypothetical protein
VLSVIIPPPQTTTTPPSDRTLAITYEQADRAKRVAKCSALLGGAGLTPEYEKVFRQITPNCMYGDRVREGMRETFNEMVSNPEDRGSLRAWHGGKSLYSAWFACPEPFSHKAATVPGGLTSRHYPCFFVVSEEVQYVYMWCLAIVLNKSKTWKVHRDRLIMIEDGPKGLL